MGEKMHKVAIVLTKNRVIYDSGTGIISNSITNWVEVSDKDFALLKEASRLSGREVAQAFTVIEQPINPKEFIVNTVEAFLAYSKKLEEKERKRVAEETKKKEENRLKRLKKKQETDLELLNRLKEKLHKEGVLP